MEVFIDANIIVYAHDEDAGEKHFKAKELVTRIWKDRLAPAISVQVLQEAHVSLVRKGAAVEESASRVRRYLAWRVVPNTAALFERALEVERRWKLSFWDSNIVAAAHLSQAKQLWTEDLNEGQVIDGLEIANPLEVSH